MEAFHGKLLLLGHVSTLDMNFPVINPETHLAISYFIVYPLFILDDDIQHS
jgi:hypothetical protein